MNLNSNKIISEKSLQLSMTYLDFFFSLPNGFCAPRGVLHTVHRAAAECLKGISKCEL